VSNKYLHFKDFDDFLNWLKDNYAKEKEASLFMFKKGHMDKGISYEEAVRAALCYGWIDSVTHSYDEEKFVQRFSPRRKGSRWSLSNIKRMKALIAQNLMTEHGLIYFDMALLDQLDDLIKQDQEYKKKPFDLPYFIEAVLEEGNVMELFEKLPKSHKKMYVEWINSAKKEETKKRRTLKMRQMLLDNKSINEL